MGTNDPYVTAIYGTNTICNWLIVERRHGRQTLRVCDRKSDILGRHKSHDCLGCLSNYTTNSEDSYTKLVGYSTVVDTLIDKEIETLLMCLAWGKPHTNLGTVTIYNWKYNIKVRILKLGKIYYNILLDLHNSSHPPQSLLIL